MADPKYVYTPRSAEERAHLSAIHKARLGVPPDCVRVFGVHVPQEHAIPLKHWASWVRQKRGWDAAADFVRSFIKNGYAIEKPMPDQKRSDWELVDEFLAEGMTREEVAEYLGVKLWYLQERLAIRKKMGQSVFGAGKRRRDKNRRDS